MNQYGFLAGGGIPLSNKEIAIMVIISIIIFTISLKLVNSKEKARSERE